MHMMVGRVYHDGHQRVGCPLSKNVNGHVAESIWVVWVVWVVCGGVVVGGVIGGTSSGSPGYGDRVSVAWWNAINMCSNV